MLTHDFLKQYLTQNELPVPALHIVLGSGLSGAFDALKLNKQWSDRGTLPFAEVPGLVPSTAPGHRGLYRFFYHAPSQKTLLFQVGRLHGFEGLNPREVVKPLVSSFRAGTRNFLLTNAAGALKKTFRVGSVMLLKDQVNLTGQSPLTGANPIDEFGQPLGPRFPDMSAVFDRNYQKTLKTVLRKNKIAVNEGIYLGLNGPAYETPAEVALFAKMGFGAVGMSTVWESIALKHLGATVAGLSFISNLGCGLTKHPLDHNEVEAVGRKIAPRLVQSLFDFAHTEFNAKRKAKK